MNIYNYRISIIKAKMGLRITVDKEDILEAYIFTKEILQNNFIFHLSNKKETVNKTKKNKINFVMEKIRQICSGSSKRIFTKTDIKEACEYLNMNDDLDTIIEMLNFHGFMIKLNQEEYQLTN